MTYQDLIDACQPQWTTYTQHPFVMQLGQGTLPHHCFMHYLKQDFLFLKQYARAYALAIYKARTLADMRRALPSVAALLDHEIAHHIDYCGAWHLTEQDMEQEPEDVATVAYTRYVLDAGMQGDIIDLYVALAPCAIGYAEIGNLLANDTKTLFDNNPYRSWIALYSGEEYQQGVATATIYLNNLLAEISLHSQRGQQLVQTFKVATEMEIAFWQQGLNAGTSNTRAINHKSGVVDNA